MHTNDSAARKPKRKTVQNKDNLSIRLPVSAKTEAQRQMIESHINEMNIVAYGSAGSGKSFVATYLALQDLFEGRKSKIVIVRSAVATRDQGFLPGSLEEKSAVFAIPYKEIVNELCQRGDAWDIMTKKGMVEFVTTSYVRGITISDAFVIFDEFQNADREELVSLLTRIGENSNIILCGDTKQSDLFRKREKSGADYMIEIAKKMPKWFDMVQFTSADIVRSGFVKALIQTIEDEAS